MTKLNYLNTYVHIFNVNLDKLAEPPSQAEGHKPKPHPRFDGQLLAEKKYALIGKK